MRSVCLSVIEELRRFPQLKAELVGRVDVEFARIGGYASLIRNDVVAKFHGRCPRWYTIARIDERFALPILTAQRFKSNYVPSFLSALT